MTSPHPQSKPGLPAVAAVVTEMALASPKLAGTTYRIIRTTEVDGYEKPMTAESVSAPLPPPGDTFAGTARKAAKLSIGTSQIKPYGDLSEIIVGLPPEAAMKGISPGQDSQRVTEEMANVRVSAFLYAASREKDNDFHLIIGRDRSLTPHRYMTMEVSGLPDSSATSFATLKSARDAYKSFFGARLPGPSYDFYDPPIPLIVEGSLFFDVSHIGPDRPGPPSLRADMPTIWEVHPITRITFEP